MKVNLTFYYRENCHLCDSMRVALLKLQKKVDLDWVEVDIDRDTNLIRLYDAIVPVLCYQETKICHYFIDEDKVMSLFANK